MAGDDLIAAYLADLSGRLPADAVDELADGLTETYRRHLSTGVEPASAARAAIREFGEPEVVLAAFVAQSPGRRAARALLAQDRPSGSAGPRHSSRGARGPGRYRRYFGWRWARCC